MDKGNVQAALKGASLPVEIHLTKGYDEEVNVSLSGTILGLMVASRAVIEAINNNLEKHSGKSFYVATVLAYKKMLNDAFDEALVRSTADDFTADLKSAEMTEEDIDIYNSMSPDDMEKVLNAMFGKSKA